MYLDTDIILALVKQNDWLKPHVNIKKIHNPKTSALTMIEAQIVLLREYGRKDVIGIVKKIKKFGIAIEEIDERIVEKGEYLLEKYPMLNVFDSIHLAFCIVRKEQIVSTDKLFDSIEEIQRIDPRSIK